MNPSLVFHQCVNNKENRAYGTLILLDRGCLIASYPALSGTGGKQEYKHQSENGGLIPCNNELNFTCYRVLTSPFKDWKVKSNLYCIVPNLISIFGVYRSLDYIHCVNETERYKNGIALLTENNINSDFTRRMHEIEKYGFHSIPLVVSYSRYYH